jgi:anti-sigma regulatory factor (Ser/Thr protein kinase)
MTASWAQRHTPSHPVARDEDGPLIGRAALQPRPLPSGQAHLSPSGQARPLPGGQPRPRAATTELLRSTYPADPSCAAAVRRAVTERLAALLPHREQLDNAAMATDELFANAVSHASSGPQDTVTVAVECSEHTLRVIVADRSPALPRPRPADEIAESGRGLAIVAALTDDWGTAPPEPGRPGKRVWFTIRRGATP